MDFKTKLAFALVAASLLSMGALGSFTYLWARGDFVADSQRQIRALAVERGRDVESILERWHEQLADIAHRIESSPTSAADPVATEAPSARPEDGTLRLIRQIRAQNEELVRLHLDDAEPLRESSREAGVALDERGTDGAADRSASDDPDGDRRVVLRGAFVDRSGGIEIHFRTLVQRPGEPTRILEAAFAADDLEDLFGPNPAVGETGQAFLVLPAAAGVKDGGGPQAEPVVIGLASGRAERIELASAPPALAAALRGEERALIDVPDHRGTTTFAATYHAANGRAAIVVQVDAAEVRARANPLLSNMYQLGLALAAFSILGGTLFGFYLGAPIHRLVQAVDRIRHGELGLRLEVKGEDEAAFLAQSLNEFMDQLDRSSDLFRLGELNVLVMSDDAKERQLLKDLLQNWRMRPLLADNAESALSAFEEANRIGQPPQLLLFDDLLPDKERDRLSAQLRAASPGRLPIVLVSDQPARLSPDALEAAGIGTVLPKPLVASHLMEAILDEMGVTPEGLAQTHDVFLKKSTPRKILLAEDNALIQRVMIEFLENWGHVVTLAADGRAALDRYHEEAFDLIFMDVTMPVMDGLEATAAIRSIEANGSAHTPIIALTAESLPSDRAKCIAAGMDDYISKPADPKALYALVERYPARVLASDGEAQRREETAMTTSRESEHDESTDATQESGSVVIDWDAARSFTNHDSDLLQELLDAFPVEARELLEEIRSSLLEEDAERLRRSAHTLKSSALVLGGQRLAESALSIESSGRDGRLEDAKRLVSRLESELEALNEELAAGPSD